MDTTTVNHVVSVAKGVVIGGLATGAVVVGAPLVLPALGLGALATGIVSVGTALPWLGAAVGGYFGHKSSTPAPATK